MTLPPLALYVHLPWCVRKCPYCDFNSHTAGSAPPKTEYIAALLRDLRLESTRVADRRVGSVFLGGGTPSLFSASEIARVLEGVARYFILHDDVEITMEANPGTVECGAPAGYLAAGVNRLSIGAQSFSDASLTLLGRIHDRADIERACKEAQDAGFSNINIDVMHSLPGQTVATACQDIEAALALEPQHLSWYQLTLEPNTVFYARPPAGLPDDELAFALQESGQAILAEAGFSQYEVSAYATDGQWCRHNVNYWEFGDYVAVGAGAHGKLTVDGVVGRYQKPANPAAYRLAMEAAGEPPALVPVIADDIIFEFVMNASRLNGGFNEELFVRRTGLPASELMRVGRGAIDKGLITVTDDRMWRPTALGTRFLNDLQAEFLPAAVTVAESQ